MSSALDSGKVAEVLRRLFTAAEENDPKVLASIRSGDDGAPIDEELVQEVLGNAYIPVSREGGRFLYILARSQSSRLIVEFGTSFGISTIHLAAAARDNGASRVVSTEKHPEKAKQARKNLADAGLAEYVEVREGDAMNTLANLEADIDFLFLDGWKDLYLPVLRLVEPRLRVGALIAADDLKLFPEVLKPYLEYVRNPQFGYTSVEIPMGDGLELSLRTAKS